MPRYWKACELDLLRKFPGWVDPSSGGGDTDGSPAAVVYLDDQCAVRTHPVADAPIIFADESAQWLEFCRTTVGFSVPGWELESARVREQFREDR